MKEIDSVFLRETMFGWIVSGTTNEIPRASNISANHAIQTCHVQTGDTLDAGLRRFWELEELPPISKLSTEEIACEKHFCATTTRDEQGRFTVQLPFKEDVKPLGGSLRQAQYRFKSIEKRLRNNPELKKEYCEFMEDYIALGHLERVSNTIPTTSHGTAASSPEVRTPTYTKTASSPEVRSQTTTKTNAQYFYLPHHCVFKPTSTTTKMRVVFDGSAKTDSGISLNESLMVGSKLQDDLFHLLVRFRFHRVAISADITKMYRQVALDPSQRDFHRILWRKDESEEIKHYRMTRVTYGIASSAFHSIRALQEVSVVHHDPIASPVIIRDFYVDDLISGSATVE